MPEYQKKGILRVFLSSTFRDLQDMRMKILDQLILALEGAAMEKFISTGKGPQITALKELGNSDIAIFLISPYYGTDIQSCECKQHCKAECKMKNETDKISYTWCEYRTALAENMPHVSYIVDEKWDTVSKDGAPKLWSMRYEVEREICPRINPDDRGIQKVIGDLAVKIPDWYSEGTINFGNFCGRRNLIKDLLSKMRRSVNVHGVGGIGKTTVCEVALIICALQGRKIVYCGNEESYASGTGYEFASEKLTSHRVPDLTIDDVIDAVGLGDALKEVDQKTKVGTILQSIERDGTVLFIDNFTGNQDLEELIGKGNNLGRGCILVSSKKVEDAAFYRIPVEGIEEEERGSLVEIMASRMGKTIGSEEQKRIEEIAEGHPMATYVLVSNVERVGIVRIIFRFYLFCECQRFKNIYLTLRGAGMFEAITMSSFSPFSFFCRGYQKMNDLLEN